MFDFKPGQSIRFTVTKVPANAGGQSTILRLMRQDSTMRKALRRGFPAQKGLCGPTGEHDLGRDLPRVSQPEHLLIAHLGGKSSHFAELWMLVMGGVRVELGLVWLGFWLWLRL